MTLKRRFKLFIHKLRVKDKFAKTKKREKYIEEKKTFESYLLSRQKELLSVVGSTQGYTDKGRMQKKIAQERLAEIEHLLEKYQDYAK